MINTVASILRENMFGHLTLDIICSSLSENCLLLGRDMFEGKYPSIFSRQMEAIVYLCEYLVENIAYDDNKLIAC